MKLPALLLLLALPIFALTQDEEELRIEEEKKAASNELDSIAITKGWVIPGCMELQWKGKDKSKLPSSVLMTNPFEQDLEIPISLTRWLVEIEYYDPHLAEWRTDLRIPGSFSIEMVKVKHGKKKQVPIPKEFWFFLTEHVPDLTAAKDTKVRLALDLGGVILRSSEFKWDTREAADSNRGKADDSESDDAEESESEEPK